MATPRNPRIGTYRNLEDGGTHDILYMGFPNGFPRGYVSFEFSDSPRKITGIQKVVQTFLKILLTRKGSDPINPSRGTVFSDYAFGANVGSDISEMQSIIREEVSSAEKQCRQIMSSSNRDTSSQLQKVEVIGVMSDYDSLTLQLRIITAAGAQAAVAIPFPQSDLVINA